MPTTPPKKLHELSVLFIEPNPDDAEDIEEILEHLGLTGKSLREKVVNKEQAKNKLLSISRSYDIIIGRRGGRNLPIPAESVYIAAPPPLSRHPQDIFAAREYLQATLKFVLEQNYGARYEE